jgi:hypothetical protein
MILLSKFPLYSSFPHVVILRNYKGNSNQTKYLYVKMLCFAVSEYFIRTLRVHDKTILELQHNLICVGSLEKYSVKCEMP